MPVGYLVSVAVVAIGTLLALVARPRRTRRFSLSFAASHALNELPGAAAAWLALATALAAVEGDLVTPIGLAALALAVLTVAGLAVVALRARRARPALERALGEGIGARLPRRTSLARILLAPLPLRERGVERVAGVAYGDAGRANRLDVYRHASRPPGAPVLIHLHGGAFRTGRKSWEARALLQRLASRGWLCVSANYRLRPAGIAEQQADVERVLRWVRERGPRYGADPGTILVAGSSAGGHLAATAALRDPSVTAAVCLYGFYGRAGGSSPADDIGPGAPPFLLVHGDRDTIVVPDDARRFEGSLRAASSAPVVYAELPGAQHAFDLFRSIRFAAVIDAVEAFAEWVRARRPHERRSPLVLARGRGREGLEAGDPTER